MTVRHLTLLLLTLAACRSSSAPLSGPPPTGGDCGTLAYEGTCRLTIARIGAYPDAPSSVIVDTSWQPADAGAGRQYFTCGPAYAVPADKGEALRRHLEANRERSCKGTFETGSCNPCPIARLEVDVPPFEEKPLTPIDEKLVRF